MVSLRSVVTEAHVCGGALIKTNVVVTAAHCMDVACGEQYVQPLPDLVVVICNLDNYPKTEMCEH